MVGLHRQQERARRLKRAQRAFSNRWQSVTSSLGYAAAAGIVMQRPGADGSAKEGSFARTVSLALRSRRAAGQAAREPDALATNGTAPVADQAALPASPFSAPSHAATNGPAQQQQGLQPVPHPGSPGAAPAGAAGLPSLPLEAAASELAARHQQLGLAPQEQPEGPCAGGEPCHLYSELRVLCFDGGRPACSRLPPPATMLDPPSAAELPCRPSAPA